ncbi:MAG: hypothetical protein ACLFUL_14760 [Desulfobacteraceae bacterium]
MNEENGLHAFLRSKATTSIEPGEHVDWEKRKRKWLACLDDLYSLIKSWLTPLEQDKTVSYSITQTTLQEDYLGSYQVDVLSLHIGNQTVDFHPKGTLIIGAEGRVDVRGPKAVRTLVLSDGQWSVVERSPRVKMLPFNEDSFDDMLQEVLE